MHMNGLRYSRPSPLSLHHAGNRIAKIEILDELEEWRMLMQHYCVAWACNGSVDLSRAMVEVDTIVATTAMVE